MENKVKTILLIFIVVFTFSACNNKQSVSIKTYIAMDKQPAEGTILKLYVDDEYEGNIPVVEGFSESSGTLPDVFSRDIKNGKHKVLIKNANDEILSVAEINAKITSRSANPTGIGSNATISKSMLSAFAYNPGETSDYKFKCVTKDDAIYLILQ